MLVSRKTQTLLIPPDPRVEAVFNPKKITYNGQELLVLKHMDSIVRALHKLDKTPPAPVLYYYDWPTNPPPLESQKKTAALLTIKQRAFVLSSIGTGKTRASLFALDWLLRTGQIERALVVAPLSTLNTVWLREIMIHFPHLKPAVLYGTRKKRFKLFDDDQFNVHIINHDAVHIIAEEAVRKKRYQLVIIDELSMLRTQRTRRWKAVNFIVNGPPKEQRALPYVWGLTATPTPNAPTDAWAQCRIINPDNVPRSFVRFRDQTMLQVSQFKWVPKKSANSIVHRAMQPAVRFTRDDCFDLPDRTYSDVAIELSKEQASVYKKLLVEFHAEFAQHKITAVNEGVRINKLLQVCGGWVYTNDGKTVALNAAKRIDELDRLINSSDAKVLVFVPFVHCLVNLFSEMKNRGLDVEMVFGETPKSERDDIFNRFQHSDEIKAIIAHPGTMSHGLTLTAADTVIWYLPVTSSEIYEQANGRITRGGQTRHQHVIHMTGSRIEERLYKRLSGRLSTQGVLLSMFEETS